MKRETNTNGKSDIAFAMMMNMKIKLGFLLSFTEMG